MATLLRHVDEIAMFGGTPLFTSPRPVGQLGMPDVDEYLALVRVAFDARTLTGSRYIVEQLERELAVFHCVDHCIAVANAGLGLIMLMQHFARGTAGEVIMPAFSYPGLPHFAQWAGQLPRFCDVHEDTHSLDVESVAAAIGAKTTSILAVCNFNSPGNIDNLIELAAVHNVAIFFDSVNGIGSTYKGRQLGSFGRAEVFSMHATKLLNGFEGGYITTNDCALASALRQQVESQNYNVLLNVAHAAMALLCLRDLDALIERNRVRFKAYELMCANVPGLDLIPYPGEGLERVTYQMAVVAVREPWPLTRDETIRLLQAEGAQIGGYYSPPLHRSVHCPPGSIVPDLPVCESLANRFVKLPVGELVALPDIEQMAELLALISRNAEHVRARLHMHTAA